MNQDTSFKNYSELYKWASEGKPIMYGGEIVIPDKDGCYNCYLYNNLRMYKKVFEKKKVTLKRLTMLYNDRYFQTEWSSCFNAFKFMGEIVKTESKEIELD